MILLDIAVAMSPVAAYYSQLRLIQKTKSLGTFSIDVCAILMISGILRIFFWFVNGYAINLLFQAIFIIAIQFVLLKECMSLIPPEKHEPETFWRWKTYDQYVKFLLGLAAATMLLTLLNQVVRIPFYSPVLGFASSSIEALLGFPQLISNFKTKSVEGLSLFMIFSWFAGDFLKTVYFVIQKQPIQFIMCGTIQLTVDILIILQIISYKKDPKTIYKEVKTEAREDIDDIHKIATS